MLKAYIEIWFHQFAQLLHDTEHNSFATRSRLDESRSDGTHTVAYRIIFCIMLNYEVIVHTR